MKPQHICKASVLLAICSAFLVSCSDRNSYYGNASFGYADYNGYSGYGSYSYGNGIYDSYGFPIFGYVGGRPVYAYNSYGSPIFSLTYIRSKCYVPSWGPASYYRGKYRYPGSCHRVSNLPHHSHGWKQPHFDKNRPSIVNRPSHRPGGSHGFGNNGRPSGSFVSNPSHNRPNINRPSYNGNRPSIGGSHNRPDFNTNRPSNRPSFNDNRPSHIESNRPSNRPSINENRPSRPSFNRPSTGIGERPSTRPSRPSMGSGSSRPSRPTFNGGERPSRPSSISPGNRPSRPSMDTPRTRPSGGGHQRGGGGSRGGSRAQFARG